MYRSFTAVNNAFAEFHFGNFLHGAVNRPGNEPSVHSNRLVQDTCKNDTIHRPLYVALDGLAMRSGNRPMDHSTRRLDPMRTILFVCTGNTCRSPMAEAIARHQIDRGLLGDGGATDIFVASA